MKIKLVLGVLVSLFVGIGVPTHILSGEVNSLKKEITELKQDNENYKKEITELKQKKEAKAEIINDNKELEVKTDIIEDKIPNNKNDVQEVKSKYQQPNKQETVKSKPQNVTTQKQDNSVPKPKPEPVPESKPEPIPQPEENLKPGTGEDYTYNYE